MRPDSRATAPSQLAARAASENLPLRARVDTLLATGQSANAAAEIAEACFANPPLRDYAWMHAALQATGIETTTRRLAALSTFTLRTIDLPLRTRALASGVDVTTWFGGYGQFEAALLADDGELATFAPDVLALGWRLEDLEPRLWHDLLDFTAAEREAAVDALSNRVQAIITAARRCCPAATILAHSFVPPEHGALGLLDLEHPDGHAALVAKLNARLAAALFDAGDAHLIDCMALARRAGSDWRDPRWLHAARAPLGPAALTALADVYARWCVALAGKARKVLVLDADNTLWGGVLGEDGLDGIALGPEYPGCAFLEFQREVRRLQRRGVVLALCSKNDEPLVREAFGRHPAMILRWDDFAATRVNWQDKAANLRELAAELSLGLDSFVFVDDSPAEIALVRQALPQVRAVQVPTEPAELPGLLSRRGEFDAASYTAEDRGRSGMYRAETQRRSLQHSSTDLESFYRSLEMTLTVLPVDAGNFERVAQLTQRTNQFNLTGRRYTVADLRQLAAAPNYRLWAYRVADRFGDNGICGATIIRVEDSVRDGRRWHIETFVLSCRVLGRSVESAIIGVILERAAAARVHSLEGEFVDTGRNGACRDFYPRQGFVSAVQGGCTSSFRIEPKPAGRRVPDWFDVVVDETNHDRKPEQWLTPS